MALAAGFDRTDRKKIKDALNKIAPMTITVLVDDTWMDNNIKNRLTDACYSYAPKNPKHSLREALQTAGDNRSDVIILSRSLAKHLDSERSQGEFPLVPLFTGHESLRQALVILLGESDGKSTLAYEGTPGAIVQPVYRLADPARKIVELIEQRQTLKMQQLRNPPPAAANPFAPKP